VPPERVRIVYGDTDQVYHGKGTFGSRSATVGSMALVHAAAKIVERAKAIAAHRLEASPLDLEFTVGERGGMFTVAGTDRAIALDAVAKASFLQASLPAGMELGLNGAAIVAPERATFPNGCHICEVEIDPETGKVAVIGYWVVDDVGRMLNPMLVKGQIHGGVAQGLGQALFEAVVYERDGGQLLSGSFMDYGMPRADDMPDIEAAANEVLTTTNLFSAANSGWNIMSNLTAPIFHGGALEAQRRAAENAFQSALANYEQTVLQSFAQVADLLDALAHDAELLDDQQQALDSARLSLSLTRDSFASGNASLLQVLDAERLYQQARLGYARAQAQRFLDTTQLFVAMGGGWWEWQSDLAAAPS